MKKLYFFFIVLLFACQEPAIIKEEEKEEKINKNEYAFSNTMKVVFQKDFLEYVPQYTIVKVKNFYVSALRKDVDGKTIIVILTSKDKENWETIYTIQENKSICPHTLYCIDDVLYLSSLYIYMKDAVLESSIFRSIDQGRTWEKLYTSNEYFLFLSNIKKNNKIALGLYAWKQNYMTNYMDFGWFNLNCKKIECIKRIVSAGDIPDEYTGEISMIEREDGAIIAAVRWADYPHTPFTQLMISYNNGNTWKFFGNRWYMAGMLNVVTDSKGNYYFAGYWTEYDVYKYTVVGKWNQWTGNIIEIFLPFGKGGFRKNRGNGQCVWDYEEEVLIIFEANGNYQTGGSFTIIQI
jgi:hypothetical protein